MWLARGEQNKWFGHFDQIRGVGHLIPRLPAKSNALPRLAIRVFLPAARLVVKVGTVYRDLYPRQIRTNAASLYIASIVCDSPLNRRIHSLSYVLLTSHYLMQRRQYAHLSFPLRIFLNYTKFRHFHIIFTPLLHSIQMELMKKSIDVYGSCSYFLHQLIPSGRI